MDFLRRLGEKGAGGENYVLPVEISSYFVPTFASGKNHKKKGEQYENLKSNCTGNDGVSAQRNTRTGTARRWRRQSRRRWRKPLVECQPQLILLVEPQQQRQPQFLVEPQLQLQPVLKQPQLLVEQPQLQHPFEPQQRPCHPWHHLQRPLEPQQQRFGAQQQ